MILAHVKFENLFPTLYFFFQWTERDDVFHPGLDNSSP